LFEDKFKTSNFLKQRNALEGMDWKYVSIIFKSTRLSYRGEKRLKMSSPDHLLRLLFIDSNPLKELPLETFSRLKSLQNLSMCKVITSVLNFVGIKSMSITNLNISYNTRRRCVVLELLK
jgi:hypothetical protein